jgi:hypothetical protein
VASIVDHIRSLESYAERSGARLVRAALPESVHGRVFDDLIMLRVDLDPQQELLTLVHELAHWLAHRGAPAHQPITAFEYEAEAVEAMVMARLELPQPLSDPCDLNGDTPTDGLLSASVTRVIWASSCVCDALGVGTEQRASQA